jgi:hypothetical protein
MKLIAPSGRTIELDFDQPASAANDEVRISGEQLSPLIGEPLNGTWSLSLRDESTGVSGHLVGWKLSLNSQVVVEDFERGLDIPDPVERRSQFGGGGEDDCGAGKRAGTGSKRERRVPRYDDAGHY